MGFIKEIYYGNISNEAQKVAPGSEYQKLAGKCNMLYNELQKKLSEDDIAKLDEFSGANFDMIGLTAEENYALGFRDGAKLMLDILTGENNNLYY